MISGRSFFGPLGISLAAVVVCIIIIATQAPALVSAALRPSVKGADSDVGVTALVARHGEEAELYRRRFEGRSAFFVPDPPPPRAIGAGADVVPPDPVDAGKAPVYAGPLKLIGVSDRAYFSVGGSKQQSVKLRAGESARGVRLLRIESANSITVAWTAPTTPMSRYTEGEYILVVREQKLGPDSESFQSPHLRTPRGLLEAESETVDDNDPDTIDREEDDEYDDEEYDDEYDEDEDVDDDLDD